ncbi:MAG: response regulator [Huintestinicola sp.]|uniref:hybrid sensor histidine kinase/response regulator n=1 Tax=Huintestinicola sp. TaxID=2981661 RepID=UPI003F128E89
MEKTVLEKQLETCRRKIRIMEHALSASAGAYYNINITENTVPGTMYQVIDDVEYSINEAIGFPDDCRYDDVIEYWGKQLTEEQQQAYFAFFDTAHLTECFEKGEDHIFHRYRTKDALGNPMLAEQHIVMYRDLVNNDLLAITYVLDHTKIEELHARDAEQRKLLEEDIRKIEGLASQYSTLYFIDLDSEQYAQYSLSDAISKERIDNIARNSGGFFSTFRNAVAAYSHPDFREELLKFADKEHIKEMLRSRKRHSYRFMHTGPDGEYQWIELVLIKFAGAEEEASQIAFAFLNVDDEENEKEEQRKALMDALAAAEHANRAKTAFLNNMSHDIRTPMNAIIGYTALAAAHLDNTDVIRDYLKKISISSSHLLSLINDVLDMSRIESGRVKIEDKEVHLPDVLHDLRTIIQSNITAKQQDLFIDTQDIIHEDIITDKLRLNQVLLNIVSNSIKFTPVGGTISIRISEKPCALSGYTTYEFRIKDNGIGMSDDFREHIFESFSREQTATVSGIQGTGLGMAITKNIVDMMGGSISVKSEEGKGSEFVVTIDCKLSDNIVKYEPIPELQGARALVADDDTDTCMSVSKMLRQIGLRADWTVSGKEAVVRAKEAYDEGDEFKAFIIDWLMPDMNGIETVRRIRKVIGDSTPIIILTAYDWSDIETEAREAGVTAFVSKPLFMSELREVLTTPVRTKIEKEERDVDFTGKKILLVEDNELNQEIASEILKEAGFIVDVAEDGIVAVEKMACAASDRYDLILMDIQMPKMNGFIATREIRTLSDNRKANIPIIAMTANAFDEDKKSAFESGMNGFVAKPINIKELMNTLADILR